MQLNNTVTGHIIISDKTDIASKRIVYIEYEKIIYNSDGTILKTFPKKQYSKVFDNLDFSQLADNTLSIEENIEKLFLTALKETLSDKDNWEISSDRQNWLFPDRPIAITILNEVVLEALQPLDANGTLSEIGQLIEREKTKNFGYYLNIKDDSILVLYANKVEDADASIIAPFLGSEIWVETKLN